MASRSTLRPKFKMGTAAGALLALGWSSAAFAACDNKTPLAGATVTCTSAAPNPDTGGILSALESTNPNNITLNVQASSTISGIYLGNGATVNLTTGSTVTGTSTGANRAIDLAGGNLTISGAVASPGAAAILLGTANGSRVTLNQGGTVTSNGGAGAIVANGDSGFFTINGTVVTNGDYFNPTGTGASVVNLGNSFTSTVGSTGSITANGARMVGLATRGTGNSLSVAGSITANGASSAAISLVRNGGSTLTNTLDLAVGGTALATGATSNAIFAADAVQIDIAGTARTTGASSTALNHFNTLAGTRINVAGTGRLVSEGGGRGIWVNNAPATITIASGGFVGDTSGISGSSGILLNTSAPLGNSTLTNSGMISVTAGTAILANGGGIDINNSASGVISGTTGLLGLGSTTPTFISNAGRITGTGGTAIDLSASTPAFEYTIFGSSVTNGTVRGGSGTNTLNFGGGPGADMGFNWNLINAGGVADGDDQYFGFTRFVKLGTNVLTLTGGNGSGPARSFTMGGGITLVSGNMAETAFTVNGGTLGGNGTLGSTTVASGATLAPGGTGGFGQNTATLTINGNLVLSAGSNTRFDIDGTANDRIIVTGTASLAGSLTAIAVGGAFTNGRYTLLTANGGVSGTFSPFAALPSGSASLAYDANNVFLDVALINPGQTFSMSSRESLVFAAPTVTTNRVNAFSTQIIGRLLGGSPLYDQTFSASFADPSVQAGVTAARAAITSAGGPGVIVGAPVRLSSTTTSVTTTGTATYSLSGPGVVTTSNVTTFGPATIQTGTLSTCNVSSLPSATRPTCTAGGTSTTVGDAIENFNTITDTAYTVNEARTDTITDTLREVYELNGQVVAVGSVHAEVQSGLFDLSGRLLGRLGQIEPGSAGWADVYAFRVRQGGRRDARGLAGGFGLKLSEGLTLGLGVDHGQIDIDLPGALESGEISLTEIGASLRYDSGPFAASLAVVKGFGNADTSRSIIGRSDARYDVRVTGVAFDMGYTIETGGWTLRPSAGIDFVRISNDGFTESDTLGLIVAGRAAKRTRASAGLGVARDFGGFSLAASARYLAVLSGDQRSVPVAFALAPARLLDMTGPSEPDGALLGARLGVPIAKGATLSLGYDGRFGGGYTAHTGTIGVRVNF